MKKLLFTLLAFLSISVALNNVSAQSGAKIEFATGRGKLEGVTWYGALIISGLNGECIGTIGGAICIDAANKFNLAGYHISRDQNVWTVTTVVQRDWLLQDERTFPVEVDPLITGPTSLWSNGYMPSCFMPNYNVDSMLVSIPGGITVTGLLVGASYYADPFTSAWMSDGSMYFSTSCGQTEEFTVTGANASLAGTAYLENFDMRNPLMCCYSPTCADQSFYLRMHLGRSYINDGCNTNYIYYDIIYLIQKIYLNIFKVKIIFKLIVLVFGKVGNLDLKKPSLL